MSEGVYLELTYRHGKMFAGYLHLPRRDGDRAVRSRKVGPGLVVDYADDGRAIGIEIVSPSTVSVDEINTLLAELDQQALGADELAPLLAG